MRLKVVCDKPLRNKIQKQPENKLRNNAEQYDELHTI